MTTVDRIFRTDETVHVICPITKIWTKSIIRGIISAWSVKIDFVGWIGPESKGIEIIVPENETQENWPVRKPIEKPTVSSKLSRSQSLLLKCTQSQLGYHPEKRQVNDIVHFVKNNFAPDIPTRVERESVHQNEPMTGWVCVNDPFLRQLTVKSDNGPFPMTTVTYEELRPAPCKKEAADPVAIENTIEEAFPSEIPPPKKKQKVTAPSVEKPWLETLTKVIEDRTDNASLTVAPCKNGIISTECIVMQWGEKFGVEKLCFHPDKV